MIIDEKDRRDGEERSLKGFKSPLISRERSKDARKEDKQKLLVFFEMLKRKK